MTRIEREIRIVRKMIEMYCRQKEGNKELCDQCSELIRYAEKRLLNCPFGERKTSCRKCTIHCYSPEMKVKIKKVMRFSGPRMLFYTPFEALKHLFG